MEIGSVWSERRAGRYGYSQDSVSAYLFFLAIPTRAASARRKKRKKFYTPPLNKNVSETTFNGSPINWNLN
jgi:hypothetical protein